MIAITLSLGLLVLIFLTKHFKAFLKLSNVPGPLFPNGIKGNIIDMMANPRIAGPTFASKYGPLYRIFTANFEQLVAVSDPELAQQLYTKQTNMAHSWDLGMGHFFHRFLGKCMGFAKERKWSNHRKTFRASMSSAAANGSLTNMSDSLDEWEMNVLEPLAKSGKVVNLSDIVGMMPITLMLKIFFGNKFINQNIKKVEQLTKDAHFIMDTVFYNKNAATSIYKFFDTESNRTMERFKNDWMKLMKAYENSEERQQGEGGTYNDVLEFLKTQGDILSFEEVCETMIEIIFGNQDILQPSLTWILADMIVYPHLIESIDMPKFWEMLDKSSLEEKYPELLDIIQESARVHPFFPISMPEIVGKDLKIGDYVLPAGTKVSIDQHSLNHNPKYWSNPQEFKPERFRNLDSFTAKWGLFRFGFGGRRCPGQYYANLVLSNSMVRLFSKYKLVPLNFDHIKKHQDVPLQTPGRFTMMPNIKVQIAVKNESLNSDKSTE